MHRYLVTDLVTDTGLGTIPLQGVDYSRRINTQGDLQGEFTIGSSVHADLARLMATRPCGLYVYRGADIWWGGIVWTAYPAGGRRGTAAACSIQAATFDSATERRRILETLTINDTDRASALRALWAHMQTGSGDLKVSTTTGMVGGDAWGGMWEPAQAETYQSVATEIMDTDPGFETTIDVWSDDTGVRHRRLRIGTPLVGVQDTGQPPHLVATPSTVEGWGQPTDHTHRPTHAMARGAATAKNLGGQVVPVTSPIITAKAALAEGAPRVDAVTDLPTEDSSRLLQAARRLIRAPYPVPSVTVTPPEGFAWNPGLLGQLGRARIESPMFDGGVLDTVARIIGYKVQPAERGRPETITFEFQPDDI